MANADHFNSDKNLQNDVTNHSNKIKELRERIAARQKEIEEKDRQLGAYWNTIQSMRLINRLRALLMPWQSIDRNSAERNYRRAHDKTTTTDANGIKI